MTNEAQPILNQLNVVVPYDAFWGARYAIVEDPDGNAVGLMSPVDPKRRIRPPAPRT